KMPIEAPGVETARHDQAASPSRAAGPPDDQARERHDDQSESSDAVHHAACGSAEQVIVQVEKPGYGEDAGGDGGLQVGAGSDVEEALTRCLTFVQHDVHGLIRIAGTADSLDGEAGIGANRGGGELFVREARSYAGGDDGLGRGRSIELVPVFDN